MSRNFLSGTRTSSSPFNRSSRARATATATPARNFLILGVPPTQRTPLITSFGEDAVAEVANSISLFNVMLANYATSFTSLFPGANLVLFDTQPIFNEVSSHLAWAQRRRG